MKRKKKKLFRLFLIILVIIIGVLFYLFKTGFFLEPLKRLHYDDKTITYLKENKIDDVIVNKNVYSKTLDQAIISDKFILDNIDYYINLKFVDSDKFVDNINSLVKTGYSYDEMEKIFNCFNDDEIGIILNYGHNVNVPKMVNLSYYHSDYNKRYLNYAFKNLDYGFEDIVTYVNIGLDTDPWENANKITAKNDDLILVNKYNMVDKDYEPDNLETVDKKFTQSTAKLVAPARVAFEKMAQAMTDEGLGIMITTSYRTFSHQSALWSNSVKEDGLTYANKYVAKPGYSEHHTGYAADLVSTNVNGGTNSKNRKLFKDTKEYAWLIDNAHKYGFILRYPSGKEKITGYNYESWHYRYVGEEVASYIYKNNLTFEEYLARK